MKEFIFAAPAAFATLHRIAIESLLLGACHFEGDREELGRRKSVRMTLLVLPLAMTPCAQTGGEDRMNKPSKDPVTTAAVDKRLVPLFRAILQYR
jgi:hypothetical protein